MLAIGALLLLMAVARPLVKRLPITTTLVYLLPSSPRPRPGC
jgi:hypothetical protein